MLFTAIKVVSACGAAFVIYKYRKLFPNLLQYLPAPLQNLRTPQRLEDVEPNLLEQFEDACEKLARIAPSLCVEESLYMYARYKQSVCGPCDTSIPPINPKSLAKWNAWRSLAYMARTEAVTEYIEKLEIILTEMGFQEGVDRENKNGDMFQGFGGGVSRPRRIFQPESSDPVRIWFDLICEGNVDGVKDYLLSQPNPYHLLRSTNPDNDEKLTALHIAADRGFVDIVALLVESGADINATDNDDQTPLHYASACDHIDTAKLLIEQGADVNRKDCCDTLPFDLAESDQMKKLLETR